MTAYKRTEITIETDEVVIMQRQRSSTVWGQEECGHEVDITRLSEANALFGTNQPAFKNKMQGLRPEVGVHPSSRWIPSQAKDKQP